MNAEQIQKLRRIILGIDKISSFSENEITELEQKSGVYYNDALIEG